MPPRWAGPRRRGCRAWRCSTDDGRRGRSGPGPRPAPETVDIGRLGGQLRRLIAWAETSPTGDRAELDFEPNPRAWAALSVSARECPGAFRCPSGTICFAEKARERAAAADVVVVNTHLYATHVASDGAVLPEHDIVVLDEAHAVEDVMTEALGVEITAGRLRAVAQATRGLVGGDDGRVVDGVAEVADRLDAVLTPLTGRRVLTWRHRRARRPRPRSSPRCSSWPGDACGALNGALRRADAATGRLVAVDGRAGVRPARSPAPATTRGPGATAPCWRWAISARSCRRVIGLGDEQVAWVEASGPVGAHADAARGAHRRGTAARPAPVAQRHRGAHVGDGATAAREPAWACRPATTDHLEVGSPFPFDTCALLYCAKHLPDPRRPGARDALHEELGSLIAAAGGRTLALFTSWRAMHEAADALRPTLPFEVLAQGDKPKAKLLDAFSSDHAACLFATMSFWQGVDVPGPTLSLVTLDRLPFSRPDDPLLQARRDRAGAAAFRTVDLPRAATLLAQGAGRLIRSSTDRGVVAVLDSRLATANYRQALLAGLPPMKRTDRPRRGRRLSRSDRPTRPSLPDLGRAVATAVARVSSRAARSCRGAAASASRPAPAARRRRPEAAGPAPRCRHL